MNEVIEFFRKLFSSADWPPRWHCGQWTAFHGWLYIISDLLIWSAYFSIPIFILRFISKKQDIRFVRLYFLFAAFILACGATHLLDAIAFWVPLYRLNALVRFITGVISWVTVFYLIKYLPVLFSLKPQNALEEEIQLRKRSEEKFKGLLEAAPDAMVIANEKGEITLINRQTEKLFGYSKDELIGKQVEILIPVDFRNKHVSHRTQYIEAPKVRSMGAGLELFAVRKDGTQFPVEISLSPLITEEGTLISASVRDITGRKRLEEKFKGLLEAAPDAMVIANEKGEITLINRQTEKLFGYSKEELIGRAVEILIPPDFHNKHVTDRTKYFADPKVRSMGAGLELFAIRKDGTKFPVEISLSPLITEEGTLISSSVRDITDRKRSEQRFRNLLEAAPDAMVIANEKGEIVLINRQTEKLFGYNKEELIGRQVEILVPADLRNKHEGFRANYSKDPKVRSMGSGLELFAVRKGGSRFPVEISLSPIQTEEGLLVSASIRDITLRKNEEEKLKIAKKDFQLLVSSVKDYAIYLLDKKGNIASWNTGAEYIKGYTAGEIIGRHFSVFYTDEEKKDGEPERNLQMTLQQGNYETDGLRVRKDGTTFFANVVITSLIDEEGKLYGFAKVTRDISEKRKTDERVRFLATIADNIRDPVISTDNNFNITRWNKPAEDLLEWKSEEAIGKNVTELLKANYVTGSNDLIFEFLKVKHSWQGEVIYFSKSGRPVYTLITASNLKDAQGNITGNLILAKDITDRKKAEKELAKLNADLEERVKERTEAVVNTLKEKNIILESIGDAFFAVDKDWTVSYWNRVAEIALSVSKDKILGKNLWQIFSDSIDSVSHKKYYEAMATNQVVHFEDFYTALNKWYEISAYPSENGLSVYFKDVTERKKAAEEIAKLNLELEERVLIRTEQLRRSAEEMEAFSYSISHDLRAPLRGIIGFANILEEDYGSKLDDEAKRITTVIKKNTTRMGMLIDDLLSFSRMGRQELIKTIVDSDKIVQDIIPEVGPDANRKKIEWAVHPLPSVEADANTLKQVWINLISNAVKYSGNADKPKIEIGSIRRNGSIVFFVKDNGVGFDEKYKTKLFKVFQRLHTSEEFEGTGIGLAIVDKIISKHGGEVWAEAELNTGATFYFSLPVDKE